MGFFRELFSKEPELYAIEKRSVQTNKALFDLIVKSEKVLNELKNYLGEDKISLKEAQLAEFENVLINIKSKVDSLRIDVQRILNIEMKHKDFILLNDDFYLKDKLSRIDTMSQVIDELLDLVGERPSSSDLKEMMSYIYGRINTLVDSVNNVSSDDKYLEEVYSRLKDF